MGAAALPAIAGIGTLGSLLQGRQAARGARSALGLQQGQAAQQAQLFGQAAPLYGDLLHALAGQAGIGAPSGIPAAQLPYTNVTSAQLGPYANPTDALRLRAAEDQSRQYTNSALNRAMFGTGQHGLYGSSIEASLRNAILGGAAQQQGEFARNLAIGAPQEYQNRLNALAGNLNPGIGAGPAAGQMFGQLGQTFGGMAQGAGQSLGNLLNAYAQYHAMQGQPGAGGGTAQAGRGRLPW